MSKIAEDVYQQQGLGKPIKYVVLTHHHSDHAGGFREYVAEVATIVTTAGTKSAFERAAATESSPLTIETWARGKPVMRFGETAHPLPQVV